MRILLVEVNLKLAEWLTKALQHGGYAVDCGRRESLRKRSRTPTSSSVALVQRFIQQGVQLILALPTSIGPGLRAPTTVTSSIPPG